MKRFIAAIVILSVLLTATIIGIVYLKHVVDDISGIVVNLMEAAADNDYDKARNLAEIVSIEWKQREKILIFATQNKEMDELTFTISGLESLVSEDYWPDLRSQCEKILTILEHIWESERPSFHNIL